MYKKNNNNNKFRNHNNHHNNNNQYSLTYKFDSNSIAGKMSGTALDLIKKYNDLAKEALSNHDYISAETFKQFAEHYRKIVTEINDRKAQAQVKKEEQKEPKEDTAQKPSPEKGPKKVKETPKEEDNSEPQAKEAPKKKTLRKKLVVAKAE